MRSRVDPAALLVAVLAVGVNPLIEPGLWDKINLITAGLVGIVLACFALPRMPKQGEEPPNYAAAVAQSLVYAFIVAVGSAFLHQLPLDPGEEYRIAKCASNYAFIEDGVERLWLRNACEVKSEDDIADKATDRALWTGLSALWLFLPALALRVRGIKRKVKEEATSADSAGESVPPDRVRFVVRFRRRGLLGRWQHGTLDLNLMHDGPTAGHD